APIELDDSLPPALSKLIMKLLAKNPDDRPQSAQAVAERLEVICERIAELEHNQRKVDRPAPIERVRTGKPTKPAMQRRWLIAAGAVGVLLLLLVVLLWAGGILRVRTPEGVLVVEVNEPRPDVYVDGTRVSVAWEQGGTKAE